MSWIAFGLAIFASASAVADESAPSTGAASQLGVATGPNPDTGLAVGSFLVYPQFFLGGVYNDNVNGTATNKLAALGVRVAPNITAVDDEGIHKTTFNFNLDGQFFPSTLSWGTPTTAANASSQVTILLGGDEVWNPTEDITVDLNGSYSRNNSVFGSLSANATSFVTSPTSVNVTNIQQYFDTLTVSGSVQKKFGNGLAVTVGGGMQDLIYEPAPVGVGASLGGLDYNSFVRGSYQFIPDLTAFVEGGADLRRYQLGWYDSDAYRLIGGLSSELIGLFRGQVYAGYQRQVSDQGTFGAVSSPTFGGTVFYYPTQYLTLAASVDQQFGTAAVQNFGTPLASPSTRTLEGRIQGDYAMAEYWTASARAGFARSSYSNSSVDVMAWTAGAGVSYNFWRNVGLTLDYNFTKSSTNSAVLAGYTQNVVSAGVTYRY